MASLIALLTDFGDTDWYAGVLKGVIKNINKEVEIVDISHNAPSWDVAGGAFMLECSYRYFPPRTVFCCIVDPGVGSDRLALAATDGTYYFCGPDNGIFSGVMKESFRAYSITEKKYMLSDVSNTFHGRDIFAPVSAYLAQGIPPDRLGPALASPVRLAEFVSRQGQTEGSIVYVDRYGNLITNIPGDSLVGHRGIRIGAVQIEKIHASYSQADEGEVFAYPGSSGYIEIAVNRASAKEKLNTPPGTAVSLY